MTNALTPAVRADWSVTNFLGNATTTVQMLGGLLLMLMGTAGIVWAGVKIWQRLMTPTQGSGAPVSLPYCFILLLVGGALATGGWQLMSAVSSGGEETILDIGTEAGSS